MAEKRKAFNQNQRAKGRDKSTIDPAPMTDCNCYGDYAKNRIEKEEKNNTENPELKTLKRIISRGNEKDIVYHLNTKIKPKNSDDFEKLNNDVKTAFDGETLLHIALKFRNTHGFVEEVLERNRKYLAEQRNESNIFKGQTILHVAIAKGNLKAVQKILNIANEKETRKLLSTCAVGTKFKNTVLMGQLPLSVAALACKDKDFKIISCLLNRKAEIWNQNKDGDTVFHSLIKYADVYPDKIQHIKCTFKFIWKNFLQCCGSKAGKAHAKPTDILFWENNAGFTPLHLSAKLGVSELFNVIVNISSVYSFINYQNGLFDIREYDVTEFDRLINYLKERKNEWNLTVLESLFDSKCTHNEAFQILNHELVQFILHRKWLAYRTILFIWMIVHFTFMLLFTVFMMEKSRLLFCTQNNDEILHNDTISKINETISFNNEAKSCNIGEEFYAVWVMNVLVGIPYLIFTVSCVFKLIGRCTSAFGNPSNLGLVLHNLDYIICLFITAVGALAECFYIFFKTHSDFHIVLVLISGWYFMLYFSPFSKNLVSFTYMIKSGFLEDFVPFATVFLWLLFSFTAIMYMLFRGADNVDEFDTFQNSLFTMFNLGVGLNNIDVLNQSRIPWLAYTIFVVFAILSFIHLFNALIAVMSQTFSNVHQDRKSYLKYNKLRMIELFEDIVLVRGLAERLPFLKKAIHWVRNDEVEPSSTYLNQVKGNKNLNSTRKETNVDQIKGRKRYFSILHLLDELNDYNDEIDIEEKKIEAKYSVKYLSKYLYKSIQNYKRKPVSKKGLNKINPENEVIFVQI